MGVTIYGKSYVTHDSSRARRKANQMAGHLDKSIDARFPARDPGCCSSFSALSAAMTGPGRRDMGTQLQILLQHIMHQSRSIFWVKEADSQRRRLGTTLWQGILRTGSSGVLPTTFFIFPRTRLLIGVCAQPQGWNIISSRRCRHYQSACVAAYDKSSRSLPVLPIFPYISLFSLLGFGSRFSCCPI